MYITDACIISIYKAPHAQLTGKPVTVIEFDPALNNEPNGAIPKGRKSAMWIQCEDAHAKLVNLANANEINVVYAGAHSYKVTAVLIGGTDCLLKQCSTEKEADDFVKDLYQQLL